MAVDEYLGDRIRAVLASEAGVSERRMFGGIAFMLRGHMCCGIAGNDFMVRVGPGGYQAALAEPHVRPMDFTGRPLKSMVYVSPDGCRSDEALARWVGLGVAFVATLPPK